MSTSPIAVVLRSSASREERDEVLALAGELHLNPCLASGDGWAAIGMGDGTRVVETDRFSEMRGVERITQVSAPYRLASREVFEGERSVLIENSGYRVAEVGGRAPLMVVIAPLPAPGGRLSSESLASMARDAGGAVVHAGELSNSDGEGGVDAEQLARLRSVARDLNLSLSVEVSDVRQIEDACQIADLVQVSQANMQNFSLLRELGRIDRPVMLRRSVGATVEEFLLAAEYVLSNGNGRVILCESSLRGQGSSSRPRFEINAVALLKQQSHLPVLADPSHASAHSFSVPAVARAAIAAGADGIMIEVGAGTVEQPSESPLDVASCRRIIAELEPIAAVLGRHVLEPRPIPIRRRSEEASAPAVTRGAEPLRSPGDVLRQTEGTLAKVIESVLEAPPRLEVVAQRRIQPPYPSWLQWVLRPEGDLLVRWTRYRMGSTTLTRNLAYVDFGRVDPTILERLESEELNLGELFTSEEIDKFGFEFGTGGNAGPIDLTLRQGHVDERSLHPYVWRRYIAATAGRIGFLVIESLPSLTWRRLLSSAEERAALREGA